MSLTCILWPQLWLNFTKPFQYASIHRFSPRTAEIEDNNNSNVDWERCYIEANKPRKPLRVSRKQLRLLYARTENTTNFIKKKLYNFYIIQLVKCLWQCEIFVLWTMGNLCLFLQFQLWFEIQYFFVCIIHEFYQAFHYLMMVQCGVIALQYADF